MASLIINLFQDTHIQRTVANKSVSIFIAACRITIKPVIWWSSHYLALCSKRQHVWIAWHVVDSTEMASSLQKKFTIKFQSRYPTTATEPLEKSKLAVCKLECIQESCTVTIQAWFSFVRLSKKRTQERDGDIRVPINTEEQGSPIYSWVKMRMQGGYAKASKQTLFRLVSLVQQKLEWRRLKLKEEKLLLKKGRCWKERAKHD